MPRLLANRDLPAVGDSVPVGCGVRVNAVTAVADGRDHLVVELELAQVPVSADGHCRALCGAWIRPAPLICPPGRRCRACLTEVARQRGRLSQRRGRARRCRLAWRTPGARGRYWGRTGCIV